MRNGNQTTTPTGLGRRHLLLLAVVAGFMVSNLYYGQPLLERIGADVGIPVAGVGWVVASAQAGYLLGLVLVVPLGDLVNRRALIALQIGATSSGATAVALASSPTALLVGFMFLGLASSVVQTIVAFTAASSTPAQRGGNIGTVTAGVVSGIILARTVAGGMTDLWSWRSVYVLAAGAGAVLAVAVFCALPSDNRDRGEVRYWRAVCSVVVLTRNNPVFRTRALITMLLFASFGVLWSGMSLLLGSPAWNLPPGAIGLFGLAGLVGILAASKAGAAADRGWGQRVTGVSLFALLGSWLALSMGSWSLLWFIAGIIVLDAAVQAVHVSSQTMIVAGAEESASSIIGSYMVFYSVGSAAGAAAVAPVFDAWGWAGASVLGAVFALLALAVWGADRVRHAKKPAGLVSSAQG
ncbi:MFS transporter [Paenarthrobacter nicotinovorans]|uniref:MFS transporter n=1 Tax=Paenarthrobacter nicotinovorans TaxID=29320 RepID=UPI001E7AB9D7|nr:MFS transporter [Arthrobacter sp. NtRootA2]BCW16251.1 MFS transporter [Arthrobacter sp. NtRootA4]BCW24583.1 MFS transporter [Arthrobacter sp. NtRootC7]BCW28854.1 MFS transporter [Arthrobacter sp. NtRootC45]BCW33124.1 MFS transporter [Arthrobacter sp. NtRootD5]